MPIPKSVWQYLKLLLAVFRHFDAGDHRHGWGIRLSNFMAAEAHNNGLCHCVTDGGKATMYTLGIPPTYRISRPPTHPHIHPLPAQPHQEGSHHTTIRTKKPNHPTTMPHPHQEGFYPGPTTHRQRTQRLIAKLSQTHAMEESRTESLAGLA